MAGTISVICGAGTGGVAGEGLFKLSKDFVRNIEFTGLGDRNVP